MKQPSNHGVTQRINPLTTSFEQLKGMVASTTGKKIPSAKALREGGTDILFVHEHDDCSITVYTNGFYIYKSYGRETVFAVDRCKEIHYQYLNDEVCTVFEREFANGPCLVPLLVNGDGRVVENLARYWREWEAFSLSNDGDDWSVEHVSCGVEDDYLRYEEILQIRAGVEQLSDRQKQIARMYFFDDMKIAQIADSLGLAVSTVHESLTGTFKRLKKIL